MITPPLGDIEIPVLEFCVKTLPIYQASTPPACSPCAPPTGPSATRSTVSSAQVTARLTDHITREDEFIGAQLWHRRLVHLPTPKLSSILV
ncbi:hypothetical protein [Nannocystis sp.]|uniref:hypothetical protein n=1 Tax=Nannocystis sp. TaxID=1962667 RepID=UPI0025E4AC06|nr:hypothetical protein [Nannocystis sp.]MBK7830551.1 hypothetical protein [Nannocystis sp.]